MHCHFFSRQRLLIFCRSHHRSGDRDKDCNSPQAAQKVSHLIPLLSLRLPLLIHHVSPVTHPQQDQWSVFPTPVLVHWLICLSSQFHALCKSQSSYIYIYHRTTIHVFLFRDYDQVSLYPDLANDETAQSADIIAQKYVHNTSVDVTAISSSLY